MRPRGCRRYTAAEWPGLAPVETERAMFVSEHAMPERTPRAPLDLSAGLRVGSCWPVPRGLVYLDRRSIMILSTVRRDVEHFAHANP